MLLGAVKKIAEMTRRAEEPEDDYVKKFTSTLK